MRQSIRKQHLTFLLIKFLKSSEGWPFLFAWAIPLAIVLELMHASHGLIFVISALGVIPTAALMGRATEELALRTGPGIGGLLNVTFGNFPELVIAFFALREGLHEVVKASLVGSIIGNVLLVLGAAMFVGGLGRERQTFNRTALNAQSSMLLVAAFTMMMPAIYQLVSGGGLPLPSEALHDFGPTVENLSLGVALVLIGSYAAGLLFSLRTHRDIFNPAQHEVGDEPHWSTRKAVTTLAVAAVLVGIMSELLVGSISAASDSIGLSEFFVGAFVIAIVGNAAEHWVAVMVARKNQMDLATQIAVGSSAQIALFVAPVLVLLSFAVGPGPMPLVFNGYELAAVIAAVFAAMHVSSDGESNWFEGLQLLLLYAVIGVTFFYA